MSETHTTRLLCAKAWHRDLRVAGKWSPSSRRQAERSEGAYGVLEWRYATSRSQLPQWLLREIKNRGLSIGVLVGSTTHVKSLWRLDLVERKD